MNCDDPEKPFGVKKAGDDHARRGCDMGSNSECGVLRGEPPSPLLPRHRPAGSKILTFCSKKERDTHFILPHAPN